MTGGDWHIPRRFLKPVDVASTRAALVILRREGTFTDGEIYPKRHQARYRAQKLILLLDECGYTGRIQFGERVRRRGDGWAWSVELLRTEQ